MNAFKKTVIIVIYLVTALTAAGFALDGQADEQRTRVVILGSGTPNPDPHHSGNSVAVIVDDAPYIVDFGPGLIRQAAALSPGYGGTIKALEAKRINRAFLTHLHSDHTLGLPDLILTPWILGRDTPLEIYGPPGIKEMAENVLDAYKEDIRYRLYGSEPANDSGWQVKTHEIKPGVVFKDANIKVEAFQVEHGTWPNAFGFRFTTPDKVIVISGDTRPCENIIKFGRNADILIHEVYSQLGFEKRSKEWQNYHAAHHTSTHELADIALQTDPGTLVLYHVLFWGTSEEELLKEITERYNGRVVLASDRDIFE